MSQAEVRIPFSAEGVRGGDLQGPAAQAAWFPKADGFPEETPRPVLTLPARLTTLFHETWKYFLVSLAALALDYSLLVGLTALGKIHYLVSAAVGFSAGLVLNYVLSIAFVFRERRLAGRRMMEFAGFLLIGLAGLALNEVLMKIFVESAGMGYALAKIPATGVGFVFNFGARRALLFTKAGRAPS
jgi:putative flippase GtrA